MKTKNPISLNADSLEVHMVRSWSYAHLFMTGIISVVLTLAVSYSVGNIIIDTNAIVVKQLLEQNKINTIKIENLERVSEFQTLERITLTAYSPRAKETDSTPFINAVNRKVKRGDIAVTRNLLKKGWTFGKKVYIEGHGVFTIMDLMNERYTNRMDIFMHKTKSALKFGKKKGLVAVLLNL